VVLAHDESFEVVEVAGPDYPVLHVAHEETDTVLGDSEDALDTAGCFRFVLLQNRGAETDDVQFMLDVRVQEF